jgi:hypothetical protein
MAPASYQVEIRKVFEAGLSWPMVDQKEMRLLGKLPDEKVAKRVGRPVNGVRIMRTRLGIPSANYRRRKV